MVTTTTTSSSQSNQLLLIPSNGLLKNKIKELLPTINLQTTGLKQFIKLLSKEFQNVDLKPRKDYIKNVLTKIMEEIEEEKEQNNNNNNTENEDDNCSNEEEDESAVEDDDDEVDGTSSSSKKRKRTTATSTTKTTGDSGTSSSGGGGGLTAVKEISNELATFLKQGKYMARTKIVKSLWDYIRTNELQNPNNKREILLDEPMRMVFQCDTFTMFTMNKYIGAHVHPYKPVNLEVNSSTTTKIKKSTTTTKKNKKLSSSTTTRSGGGGGNKNKKDTTSVVIKKKRKVGSQPPYRLSESLQKVVYESILPRPQVVSKIWDYIKTNQLQNPQNKREILCDDFLYQIMKKRKVTMFEMNTLLSPHLLEKVDKSQYHHKEKIADDDNHDNNYNTKKKKDDDDDEEDSDDDDNNNDSDSNEEGRYI